MDDFEEAVGKAGAEAGAVTVKPLEWVGDFAATGLGLSYTLTRQYGSVPFVLRIHCGAQVQTSFWKTEREAKAIAQIDFERRIFTALSPAAVANPSPDQS